MHNTTPSTGISTAAVVYLVVAGIAATALAGSIAVELFTPLDVKRGVSAFLAAVIAVAGYGCLVRCAEDRLARRLDQLEQRLAGTNTAAAAERINLRLLQGQG